METIARTGLLLTPPSSGPAQQDSLPVGGDEEGKGPCHFPLTQQNTLCGPAFSQPAPPCKAPKSDVAHPQALLHLMGGSRVSPRETPGSASAQTRSLRSPPFSVSNFVEIKRWRVAQLLRGLRGLSLSDRSFLPGTSRMSFLPGICYLGACMHTHTPPPPQSE